MGYLLLLALSNGLDSHTSFLLCFKAVKPSNVMCYQCISCSGASINGEFFCRGQCCTVWKKGAVTSELCTRCFPIMCFAVCLTCVILPGIAVLPYIDWNLLACLITLTSVDCAVFLSGRCLVVIVDVAVKLWLNLQDTDHRNIAELKCQGAKVPKHVTVSGCFL